MRIAHMLLGRCNPDSANGVDKTVYHLARHQATLGAEVAVFSLANKDPLPVPGAEVRIFSPPGGLEACLAPFPTEHLVQAIFEWKPRLVCFHSVHMGPFVGIVVIGRRLKEQRTSCSLRGYPEWSPRSEKAGLGFALATGVLRLLEKPYLRESEASSCSKPELCGGADLPEDAHNVCRCSQRYCPWLCAHESGWGSSKLGFGGVGWGDRLVFTGPAYERELKRYERLATGHI